MYSFPEQPLNADSTPENVPYFRESLYDTCLGKRFFVQKLTSTAKIPTKGSPGAAGFDLYADLADIDPLKVTLTPGSRTVIDTGCAFSIPSGWYGRVAPRSGLAMKGIQVLAGVIDSDYRGPVKVILLNSGTEDVTFSHGDRIAQLILENCGAWHISEVDTLPTTERGAGGFGSTGK